jgi:hypothetical protein
MSQMDAQNGLRTHRHVLGGVAAGVILTLIVWIFWPANVETPEAMATPIAVKAAKNTIPIPPIFQAKTTPSTVPADTVTDGTIYWLDEHRLSDMADEHHMVAVQCKVPTGFKGRATSIFGTYSFVRDGRVYLLTSDQEGDADLGRRSDLDDSSGLPDHILLRWTFDPNLNVQVCQVVYPARIEVTVEVEGEHFLSGAITNCGDHTTFSEPGKVIHWADPGPCELNSYARFDDPAAPIESDLGYTRAADLSPKWVLEEGQVVSWTTRLVEPKMSPEKERVRHLSQGSKEASYEEHIQDTEESVARLEELQAEGLEQARAMRALSEAMLKDIPLHAPERRTFELYLERAQNDVKFQEESNPKIRESLREHWYDEAAYIHEM